MEDKNKCVYHGSTFVNLCFHEIKIIMEDGTMLVIPESGVTARCKNENKVSHYIDGVPITVQDIGEVQGVPEEKPNTYYIVSQMVRDALPERKDLLVAGPKVKNIQGYTIGCKSLSTGKKIIRVA